MKKLIVLAACMVIASAVQARLGETYDQCIERYGQPVSDNGKTYEFKKPPFNVSVTFRDNRAVAVFYQKPGSIIGEHIQKTEVLTILDANKSKWQWVEYDCPEPYKDQHYLDDLWKRSDGAIACYQHSTRMLVIVDESISFALFSDGKKTTSGL